LIAVSKVLYFVVAVTLPPPWKDPAAKECIQQAAPRIFFGMLKSGRTAALPEDPRS
jgi:hypothetical protein